MKQAAILFVSHASKLHGAERSLLSLAVALQRGGRVAVTVLVPRRGPLLDELRAAGVSFLVVPFLHWIGRSRLNRRLLGPLRLALNWVVLGWAVRKLRTLNLQCVYSNSLGTPFGAMLAAASKKPHIWHIREFVHEDMGREFDLVRFSHRLISDSAAVICNSAAVSDKWRRVLQHNNINVVYNGFDFPPRHSETGRQRYGRCVSTPTEVKLVYTGQIAPHKGVEDAVRALALLRQRGHRVSLEILGDGAESYRRSLVERVVELDLAEAVYWRGFVPDPASNLYDAAVALVCSRNEAFGRVAVEAMSLGVPVVGTDSGGLPEILREGKTGLLYPPGDHHRLALAIDRLIADADLYAALSEAGDRSVRERFSLQSYVDGVRHVLHEIDITC